MFLLVLFNYFWVFLVMFIGLLKLLQLRLLRIFFLVTVYYIYFCQSIWLLLKVFPSVCHEISLLFTDL